MNTETENEASQEPKSYAAKPRNLRSALFSRRALSDEFWSLSGRASRSEFCWTAGGCFLFSIALALLVIVGVGPSSKGFLMAAAVFWSSIPVTVRRFHDMGNSGWWTALVIGPWIATDILEFTEMLGNQNLLIISLVCLIAGYIVLSRKGTPEKTRFDKDD